MPPFPLIPSVPTGISFLVPGIEILLIVLKEVAEAGGMATVLNVLFCQISMVFIRGDRWTFKNFLRDNYTAHKKIVIF